MSSALTPIVVTHSKSGAKAEVYPFGASVTSYQTSSGRELLFVTSAAKLDGSKAIRGGIPLVFPQFGKSLGFPEMPSHGFARINTWKEAAGTTPSYDNDQSAGIVFQLTYKQDVQKGAWVASAVSGAAPYDCLCTYEIDVAPEQLTTKLTITNTGESSLPYQALFHTYLKIQNNRADDPQHCHVLGLEGYQCQNNMAEGKPTFLQGQDPVIVQGETEKIFTPPAGKTALDVRVATGDGTYVRVMGSSSSPTSSDTSCVVWNPNLSEKAKQMSDFDETEYNRMLCVEPGWIGTDQTLAKGESCTLTQILKAES